MLNKLLICSLLTPSLAIAGPWDFNINQYDGSGANTINRLTSLPSGSVSGILVYDVNTNLPKLATVDSSLTISTSNPPVISASASAPAWSSLTGTPPNVSVFTNDSGYITSSALSPYATTAALTAGLATKGSR